MPLTPLAVDDITVDYGHSTKIPSPTTRTVPPPLTATEKPDESGDTSERKRARPVNPSTDTYVQGSTDDRRYDP